MGNQNDNLAGGNADRARVAELMKRFAAISSGDAVQRDQILDEMQDAVGLAGKMVMEADILRRAKKILGQP